MFSLPNSILKKMQKAKQKTLTKHGKKLNFFVMSEYFPSISLTGSYCQLRCKHCDAILLKRLISANKKNLFQKAIALYQNNAKGILLTGGCDKFGKVPIAEFSAIIKKIKEKTKLKVICHSGFIDYNEAISLKNSGLDGIAFDVVGSSETAKEVYGINVSEKNYIDTLKAIEKAKIDTFPHVCVGLHFGKLKGELNALELIKNFSPITIVITGLMPLKNTPMEKCKPKINDFAKVISHAVLNFNVPITLGCARSIGKDKELIDIIAIESGVLNIAVPTRKAINYAKENGYEIHWYGSCCGLMANKELEIKESEIKKGEWVYF